MKANIRGIDLFYDDVGRAPAIVFLHGYPFNRSMWRAQIDFFAARDYRCIAPDLRGLGQSVTQTLVCERRGTDQRLKSVPLTTMTEMASDVAALIDDLIVERALIVGLSMGSYIALEFVHLFPSRVQALVLAGARAQGADESEKQAREEQARRVMVEGIEFAAQSILKSLLAPATFVDKHNTVARVREMILETDPQGAAAAQRGMALRRDYSGTLHNIEVPTLIIAGREDGVRNPADAQFLHRGIPNSSIEIIDAAGHLMNMEQPEVFNQALLRFVSQVPD